MPVELLDPTTLMFDLTKEPDLWRPQVDFQFGPSNIPASIKGLPPGRLTIRLLSEKEVWQLRANFLEHITKIFGDPSKDSLEGALECAKQVGASTLLIVDSRFNLIDQYKV
jgi:hypothetical protein